MLLNGLEMLPNHALGHLILSFDLLHDACTHVRVYARVYARGYMVLGGDVHVDVH